MWMMGYNDGCGDFSVMQDPFNGSRKLRPLVPRPSNSTGATTPPCCSRIHASSDFLAQYHQLGLGEQQRAMRDFNAVVPQVVVSSRWNPTQEQLRALEELYRRGTRTPSAEQIQQITAQLRRYGKIEGKNVFYWFQNHKARERQKRRRQMESHDVVDLQFMPSSDHQKKELTGSGGNRTMYEVEETKNWAPSSTICMTHTLHHHQQESVKAVGAESRTDGWIPFDEQEFQQQQRRNSNSLMVEKNATWQMMQLSSCPSLLPDFTHLINSPTCCTTASSTTTRTTDQKQQKQHLIINHKNDVTTNNTTTSPTGPPPPDPPHDLSIFIAPSRAAVLNHHRHRQHRKDEEDQGDQSLTLELFPLRSNFCGDDKGPLATEKSAQDPNFSTGPSYQFFEFLPLKN